MKKYFYQAAKHQLEKPTEPQYVSCAPATVIVFADSRQEADRLAQEKLECQFYGTGLVLGAPQLVKEADLPVDWSYGYGENCRPGDAESMAALKAGNVIR